ncbi:riboflavin synthase-like beta-barrel [Desulfoluna butyratoxydans]|uniref:Dihydroorotate dehydrogenase B (NAD(+)), electron transfer subunit n=2 Tax=Desulfoluna butyratoxydans TaxID=231438 RepID=A0A4U8YGK6_9BACT|nr:riboflavin synthase-like beta-barrel [Desulfoluna butyratoxydans]
MKLSDCTLLWNREVSPGYYHMGLEAPARYTEAAPGQFVMLKAEKGGTLLRRPFSIHDVTTQGDKTVVTLLYKVVGPNTRVYAGMKEGDVLSMLGPLGNRFTEPQAGETTFLAGGGIGIAPMLLLARRILAKGGSPSDHTVFIGGRTREDVLAEEAFRELGFPVVVTTDDGSAGEKGRITAPMARLLNEKNPAKVYACGPHPMLVGVADLMDGHDALCELSLEIIMACGMGACMGCVVESSDEDAPYRHVCIDGPVFDARTIKV